MAVNLYTSPITGDLVTLATLAKHLGVQKRQLRPFLDAGYSVEQAVKMLKVRGGNNESRGENK